ncbi:uncharacterized protein LOC131307710 isoform X2 [Rhododendron vialii]|uniref:uncharacterized protein LOC131307710 isoform X2 n=1 Tax=Rhododendron vialii TaxID=182163 RepID=UPI0026601F2F|nr:uncharacterized protein LOC131307710 isoform X2 [Rhododendron vialii]
MAKDGKVVFKPGELALETRNYLEKRKKLIEENCAKIEALGCKQLANPFLKKSTTAGKRRHKMDCVVNDDVDWQPADGEDGSSSCFEDDECSLEDEECSEGRLSKVATTRKRVQLSAGPMSAILQPLSTINQDQHGNQQVQLQEQPQPQVQAKRVRYQAAPMSATLQPSPTISQDQHENQSAQLQLQAQPQVQAKRVRCRAAPMSTILQPLPTISQDQHGNQLPPNYHEFQSPSDEGHVNERAVELESHQQSMSSHTTSNLQSLEQCNEGSRTSVGADPNSQQQRAKGRGFARPYVGWGTGAKLEVKLNKDNQPIGNTAGPLQSQLGILARNATLAPLTFTDWRAPELYPYKERIWAEVKENTTAPDAYKHNCLMSVGKKWKDWKDELKRSTYNLYDNDEDRLANCPNRVDPDQWRVLVKFWGTKTAKRRSKTNYKSRHEQKMGHTSGRKGHCHVRDELTQIKDGVVVEPDRIQVFIKTHTKKDGQPVDEVSALAIRLLNEGASQIPESSESPALREELFTNVLKPDKNGRVRTYGMGPCPSQVFGTRYTQSHEQRVKDQLRKELRVELGAELRAKLGAELRAELGQEVLKDVSNEITQLKNQYATMAACMKSAGHLLPPSPNGAGNGDGDHTPSLMEHNGQVDRT